MEIPQSSSAPQLSVTSCCCCCEPSLILESSWNEKSRTESNKIRLERLTCVVVTRSDDSSTLKLLQNLRVLKPDWPPVLSEALYPHPFREFKLLNKEEVYNLDMTRFKRRCLEAYYSQHIWLESEQHCGMNKHTCRRAIIQFKEWIQYYRIQSRIRHTLIR